MTPNALCNSIVFVPESLFLRENVLVEVTQSMSSSSSQSTMGTFLNIVTTPCSRLTASGEYDKGTKQPLSDYKMAIEPNSTNSVARDEGIEIEHIDLRYSNLGVIFQKSSDSMSASSELLDIEKLLATTKTNQYHKRRVQFQNWDEVFYDGLSTEKIDELWQEEQDDCYEECNAVPVEDSRGYEQFLEQTIIHNDGYETDQDERIVQEPFKSDSGIANTSYIVPETSHERQTFCTPYQAKLCADIENDNYTNESEDETNLPQQKSSVYHAQKELSTKIEPLYLIHIVSDSIAAPIGEHYESNGATKDTSSCSFGSCNTASERCTNLTTLATSLQEFDNHFLFGLEKSNNEDIALVSDSDNESSDCKPSTFSSNLSYLETSSSLDKNKQNVVIQHSANPPDFSKLEWIPKLVLYLSSDMISMVETSLFELGLMGNIEHVLHEEEEKIIENRVEEVYQCGAHSSIIMTMAKWYANQEVQLLSCRALHNLGGLHREFRDACAKFGAFEAIIQAMNNFPNNVELQRIGCACLCCLSSKEESAKHLVLELHGLNVITKVMKTYPDDEFVQVWCCSAINNMSNMPELLQTLRNASVLEILIAIADNFTDDNDNDHVLILDQTCRAVKNILFDSEEK